MQVIDIHGHLVIPKSEELLAGSNVKGDYPRNQILGPDRLARMVLDNALTPAQSTVRHRREDADTARLERETMLGRPGQYDT